MYKTRNDGKIKLLFDTQRSKEIFRIISRLFVTELSSSIQLFTIKLFYYLVIYQNLATLFTLYPMQHKN